MYILSMFWSKRYFTKWGKIVKSCCAEQMVFCRKLKKNLPTARICVINVYTTVGMLGNIPSLLNDILKGLSVCFKIQLI